MPRFEVRTIEWVEWRRFDRKHFTRSPAWEAISRAETFAEAEADCETFDRERWALASFNPFQYGGESLYFQTTMPPGVFCDYLQDHEIDLPAAGLDADNPAWIAWWWKLRPTLTFETQAVVRAAMNLIRFAEVVDVPAALETVYMIQEIHWEHADNSTFDADAEGGTFVAVYRDRSKAETRCAELNAVRRAEPYYQNSYFATDHRAGAESLTDKQGDEAVFYEVVELELDMSAVVQS